MFFKIIPHKIPEIGYAKKYHFINRSRICIGMYGIMNAKIRKGLVFEIFVSRFFNLNVLLVNTLWGQQL
jgi:hypothetical protein